ncbi:MAG: hypothetical protein ABR865_11790 [Terracidiphilus sp.]|jgi:hypothetical protein
MGSSPADNPILTAETLIDRMKKHYKFLQWDREINGKLYYALWIVFVGGFVLSINSTVPLASPSDCTILLLRLFRILAILGSVLNFILQSKAIDAVRFSHDMLMEYGVHRTLAESFPVDALKAHERAEVLSRKLIVMDAVTPWLECALIVCAALFLICALIITWNIIPLASTK